MQKAQEQKKELNERILEDNYPIYIDYLYVGVSRNGTQAVLRSSYTGTVSDLKKKDGWIKVKNCDIIGRGLAHLRVY
jgi:hypothetical protein